MTLYKGNIAKIDQAMYKVTGHYTRPIPLLQVINGQLNPRNKHGKFSIVEDVLLLLAMEQYRERLLKTGNFEAIAYTLPWRCSSDWRARFGRLMTGFYSKMWTL